MNCINCEHCRECDGLGLEFECWYYKIRIDDPYETEVCDNFCYMG